LCINDAKGIDTEMIIQDGFTRVIEEEDPMEDW
jgi:hypothetical protein